MAKAMPISKAAGLTRARGDAARATAARHVEDENSGTGPSKVQRIGVDETSRGKGRDYVAVVTDTDARKAICDCCGSGFNTVGKFCNRPVLRGGNPHRVCDVSRGLDGGFDLGIELFLPNARVTYDKLRLPSKAADAVDEARPDGQAKDASIKRTRCPLLRRPEKLSEDEKERLGSVMTDNCDVGEAYRLTEPLWDTYSLKSKADAPGRLDHWVQWACVKGLKPFHKAARPIKGTRTRCRGGAAPASTTAFWRGRTASSRRSSAPPGGTGTPGP
jgi:hypothetical protein